MFFIPFFQQVKKEYHVTILRPYKKKLEVWATNLFFVAKLHLAYVAIFYSSQYRDIGETEGVKNFNDVIKQLFYKVTPRLPTLHFEFCR